MRLINQPQHTIIALFLSNIEFTRMPQFTLNLRKPHKKSGHQFGNRFVLNKYQLKIYELLSPNTSSKITTIQSVMAVLNTYLVIGEKERGMLSIFQNR